MLVSAGKRHEPTLYSTYKNKQKKHEALEKWKQATFLTLSGILIESRILNFSMFAHD